jgi:peptidoglycan/xylan/chitin deacetylase (PgdA/CDA1 family)
MRSDQNLNKILSDYYRVPEDGLGRVCAAQPSGEAGYFRFGSDAVCYGQCASGVSTKIGNSELYDACKNARLNDSVVHLPFDPTQVVDNLRRERYVNNLRSKEGRIVDFALIRKAYYFVRKLLPVAVRKHFQKMYLSDWQKLRFPNWPVDFTVDNIHEKLLGLSMEAGGVQRVPFIWFWPEGAPNCLIMTHDVETTAGRDFTPDLMDLDQAYGVKASFQVVPENRYEVPDEYIRQIASRGFEVNVHDLNHDGNLYQERGIFLERAKKINEYARKFDAVGFRAGVMYRNLEWFDAYEFSYDMSVPNVAHLDPQRGGCCTVFPYFVGKILEIPLTTCQDYSLFQILNDYSIDLWKKQLELIRRRNGLMSFIAHPDYLMTPQARGVYESLLDYLRQMVKRENIWVALPKEVDRWWRARAEMNLVEKGGEWVIEGPESERARVAFAVLRGDRLVYEVAGVAAEKNVRS